MDLIHKSHNLSKEIGTCVYLAFWRLKLFHRSFWDFSDSCPLQRRRWKDRHLHRSVQAVAGLPQHGGDQAGHHGHSARYEEATLSDGSEERAVRLCRQMSQVGIVEYENKISKFFFFSFIVSVEKGGYYEGEEEEDEYYEMQDDELISQEV